MIAGHLHQVRKPLSGAPKRKAEKTGNRHERPKIYHDCEKVANCQCGSETHAHDATQTLTSPETLNFIQVYMEAHSEMEKLAVGTDYLVDHASPFHPPEDLGDEYLHSTNPFYHLADIREDACPDVAEEPEIIPLVGPLPPRTNTTIEEVDPPPPTQPVGGGEAPASPLIEVMADPSVPPLNQNVLICCPSGTGKSYLCERYANLIDADTIMEFPTRTYKGEWYEDEVQSIIVNHRNANILRHALTKNEGKAFLYASDFHDTGVSVIPALVVVPDVVRWKRNLRLRRKRRPNSGQPTLKDLPELITQAEALVARHPRVSVVGGSKRPITVIRERFPTLVGEPITPSNLNPNGYPPSGEEACASIEEDEEHPTRRVMLFVTGDASEAGRTRIKDIFARVGHFLMGPFSVAQVATGKNHGLPMGQTEVSKYTSNEATTYSLGFMDRTWRDKPWYVKQQNTIAEFFSKIYSLNYCARVYSECVDYALADGSLSQRRAVNPDGKITDIMSAVKFTVLAHAKSSSWSKDQTLFTNTLIHITNQVLLRGLRQNAANPTTALTHFRSAGRLRTSPRIDPSLE